MKHPRHWEPSDWILALGLLLIALSLCNCFIAWARLIVLMVD